MTALPLELSVALKMSLLCVKLRHGLINSKIAELARLCDQLGKLGVRDSCARRC